MPALFSNNATATLASSITVGQTTISVTAGQGALFPSPAAGEFFYATLIDASNNIEIVKVTARTSDTLTVSRGEEGTTARAYAAADRIELRVTAGGLNNKLDKDGGAVTGALSLTTLNGLVRANGTGALTAVAAPAGAVVGTSDTQNLSNKTFSGNTYFSGLTGLLVANSSSPITAVPLGSGDVVTTTSTQTLTNKTLSGINNTSSIVDGAGTFNIGYRDSPTNYQYNDFTLDITQRGKCVILSKGSAQAVYIPTYASVPFPGGTTIVLYNNNPANVTVSPAGGVSLRKPITGGVSSVTISAYGIATLLNLDTGTWVISGAGVV